MKKFTKLFLLDVPGLFLALAAISCSGTTQRPVQARAAHEVPGAQGAPAFVVAAAGDIACDPRDRNYNGGLGSTTRCHMQATSDLLFSLRPEVVLTMGDDQYLRGGLDTFLQSYDRTWGRFRSITRPTPGNHEYWTANAAGYFAYFGEAAGPVGITLRCNPIPRTSGPLLQNFPLFSAPLRAPAMVRANGCCCPMCRTERQLIASLEHSNLFLNYAFDKPTSWRTPSRGRSLLGVLLCKHIK